MCSCETARRELTGRSPGSDFHFSTVFRIVEPEPRSSAKENRFPSPIEPISWWASSNSKLLYRGRTLVAARKAAHGSIGVNKSPIYFYLAPIEIHTSGASHIVIPRECAYQNFCPWSPACSAYHSWGIPPEAIQTAIGKIAVLTTTLLRRSEVENLLDFRQAMEG